MFSAKWCASKKSLAYKREEHKIIKKRRRGGIRISVLATSLPLTLLCSRIWFFYSLFDSIHSCWHSTHTQTQSHFFYKYYFYQNLQLYICKYACTCIDLFRNTHSPMHTVQSHQTNLNRNERKRKNLPKIFFLFFGNLVYFVIFHSAQIHSVHTSIQSQSWTSLRTNAYELAAH